MAKKKSTRFACGCTPKEAKSCPKLACAGKLGIEATEEQAAEAAAPEKGDLFVALGDLTGKSIAHLRKVLEDGDRTVMESYEGLVEDFIETFNHAVTQGVPPEWALFAFTQAYAITMGQCMRAGLDPGEAGKFIATIVQNADLSKRAVQQISSTSILLPSTTGKKQ